MRTNLRLSATVALLSALPGCFPAMRPSDAGHASFVRQAVPILQGRQPSYDEVALYSDAIVALGDDKDARYQLVMALMEENRFVDHWSAVLAEHLRVVRAGDQDYAGCYDDYRDTLPASAWDAGLARAIRGTRSTTDRPNPDPATSSFAGGATLTAILRSSLYADDLSVAWRANLFAFGARPMVGAMATAETIREDYTKKFLANYVERDLACTTCHNSSWSTTGEQTWWDRTWPVPVSMERALFGSHAGGDPAEVGAFFPGASSSGTAPWGMTSCGTLPLAATPPSPVSPRFGGAETGEQGTVWDLDAALSRGVWKLAADGLNRRAPLECAPCAGCDEPASSPPAGFATLREEARAVLASSTYNCSSCHGGNWASQITDPDHWDDLLLRVSSGSGRPFILPGNAAGSEIYYRVTLPDSDPNQMPRGSAPSLSTADKNKLRDYINAIPTSTGCDACMTDVCDSGERIVDGDEAFAFMVAAGIVDRVFAEVYGKPLTIVNGFPRNMHSLMVYSSLTQNMVHLSGRRGWSLKHLLAQLLTSQLFNRLPPSAADGTNPYELPLLVDPWTEGDPRTSLPPPTPPIPPAPPPRAREAFEEFNTMTEAVHRRSPDTLLRSVSYALDWPLPRRMLLSTTGYPHAAAVESVGSFINYAKPGSRNVDFQGLLTWEGLMGSCQRPGIGGDWIDELVGRVGSSPPGSFTYRQVILALKDRLISDPTISESISDPLDPFGDDRPLTTGGVKSEAEADVLEAHFGVSDLSEPILGAGFDLESKLRGLCGALLDSPQFWLKGVARRELGENPGIFPPEPRCEELRDLLARFGIVIECGPGVPGGGGSVTMGSPLWGSAGTALGGLCAGGSCGTLAWSSDATCNKAPQACVTEQPICNPSCTELACCGTSARLIPDSFEGALYTALDGTKIIHAEGVTLRRAKNQYAPEVAKQGVVLATGDILTVGKGAQLVIDAGSEIYKTPKEGVKPKSGKGQSEWTLMVAGVPDLGKMDPLAEVPVPHGLVKKLLRTETRRWGAAGPRHPQQKPQQPKK